MYLKELIDFLSAADQDLVVLHGFSHPHSYRGSYDQLAFELTPDVTVASMLACAKRAVGNVYSGYKGGEYTMGEYTECHLAEEGCTGPELSRELLTLLLNESLMSVGKETSLVAELRAKLAERDAEIRRLRELWVIATTRGMAAHERARKTEENLEALEGGVRECEGDGGCRATKLLAEIR